MSRLFYTQRGLSITSWIAVIAIVLFFLLMGIRIVPSYMEFYSIKEVVAAIAADAQYKTAPLSEIRAAFMRRIDINGIYHFDKDGLILERAAGKTTIGVDYEVRKEMAGNISVVMSFNHEVQF